MHEQKYPTELFTAMKYIQNSRQCQHDSAIAPYDNVRYTIKPTNISKSYLKQYVK